MTSAIRAQREAEDGFTLIELLVVVIIIGILAAIAIPAFLNQRQNAWTSAVESDLRNAAIEMESAATTSQGLYPTALPAAVNSSTGVTVTLDGTSSTSQFCLTGSHTNVSSDAVIRVFDSDSGGLRADGDCDPTNT